MTAAVSSPTQIAQEVERDPISLVRQYVNAPSGHIRRNAATALATLSASSPHAAQALVDMALHEKDEHVALHILSELAALPETVRETVVNHVRELFSTGPQGKRSAAYLLLVRLRALGWTIPPTPQSAVSREMLMALTADETVQGRRFTVVLVGAVLLASVVAALTAVIYVLLRVDTIGGTGYVVTTVAVAMAAATMMTLLASRASIPAYLHLRRGIGNTVDAFVAFVLALLIWLATIVIVQAMAEFRGSAGRAFVVALLAALTVGAAVGGARAGALLAHEMPPMARFGLDPDWRRRLLSGWATRMFIAEIAFGVTLGFFAALGMDALARALLSPPPVTDTSRVLDGSFWVAMIVVLPCAVASALIDRPRFFLKWTAQDMPTSIPEHPERPRTVAAYLGTQNRDLWVRTVRRVVEIAVLASIFVGVNDLFLGDQPVQGAVRFATPEESERRLWMMSFPAQYDFVVGFLQPITFSTAATANRDDPELPLRAQLFESTTSEIGPDGVPVCGGGTDAERVSVFSGRRFPQTKEFGRGCYTLEITRAANTELGRMKALRALLDAWSVYRSGKLAETTGAPRPARAPHPYELRVVANSKKFRPVADVFAGPPTNDAAVGSWRIEAVPWERDITVTAPIEIQWALTPAQAPITPDAPGQGSATNRREESEDLVFSLVRDEEEFGNFARIEPGKYTLRVTSERGTKGRLSRPVSCEVAVANRRLPTPTTQPPLYARLDQNTTVSAPLNGLWQFDALPASFTFNLQANTRMEAILPELMFPSVFAEGDVVDLQMALESGGKEIQVVDTDPEKMERILPPGVYTLRIYLHGEPQEPLDVDQMWLSLQFARP